MSTREIADFLGDKIATVERNYYHHSPDYLRGAADWRSREAAPAAVASDPANILKI
ncbi:hypothetical protein [Reyranella sp.]|uniref:hypothetical protein n=1 Tax=Reyranella sp. TaxID=1929291 RepID=UPI00378309A2